GEDASQVPVRGEPRVDPLDFRCGPRRADVPGLQDHVVETQRFVIPGAGERERSAVPNGVVAEVRHGEERVVRNNTHRGRRPSAIARDEGENLPLAPILARWWRD